MHRRTLLGATFGIASGLAGCTGILGDSGDSEDSEGSGDSGDSEDSTDADTGDGSSPAETVEAFYQAVVNDDAEAARSFFHPDAEMQPPSDQAVADAQQRALQLEATTVIEEGEAEATVEATVCREVDDGDREDHTVRFLLRPADGEWRIYDSPLAGSGGPAAPQVQWDVTERTESDAVTAVVFEHNGGDTIDPSTLSATVDGSAVGSSGTASDVVTGTTVVIPFDGDGASVETGATVELVWTDPDGSSSQILASFTLTSDTSGSPAEQLRIE